MMNASRGSPAALSADEWQRRFGYKPVSLFSTRHDGRHILLNGPQGGICLDTTSPSIPEDARSVAWSSDALHYLHVGSEQVGIARPGRSDTEFVPRDLVERHFDTFESKLQDDDELLIESVSSRAAQAFGSLRAHFADEEGLTSVRAFLALLAARAWNSNLHDVSTIPHLSPGVRQIAAQIPLALEHEFSRVLSENSAGLNLDAELVLRHAAGKVFQEAHYRTILSPQLSLSIVAPRPGLRGDASQHGIFFTPASLARSAVEQGLQVALRNGLRDRLEHSPLPVRIFDPACGSGELLKEFVRQFRSMGFVHKLQIIGWDTSPTAVEMASFVLAFEPVDSADIQISSNDSLANIWPEKLDFIVMNPPFISREDLTAKHRAILAKKYAHVARGRADISFAFLYDAICSLAPQAVMTSLLPASILNSNSAGLLRREIEQRGTPGFIAHYGSQGLFNDAQVDTGVLVVARGEYSGSTTYAWSNHERRATNKALRALRVEEQRGRAYDEFNVYDSPFEGSEGGWTPRSLKDVRHLARYRNAPLLSLAFTIDQGTVTGRNQTFILTSREVASLPESERQYFADAVMNRSISDARLKPGFKVFFPYFDRVVRDETELRARLDQYYKRWLHPDEQGLKARKDRQGGIREDPWWELSRNVKPLGEPKIISTYFGESGKYALDLAGTWVPVQAYAYRFKHTDWDSERIWYAALAVLNSKFYERFVAALSTQLGGGQLNLSIRYVGKVPFPTLVDPRIRPTVDRLAVSGEKLHYGKWKQLLELEQDVEQAYEPWISW